MSNTESTYIRKESFYIRETKYLKKVDFNIVTIYRDKFNQNQYKVWYLSILQLADHKPWN